jgi:16S rRNA (uracil1498-N3)-methyltransferase
MIDPTLTGPYAAPVGDQPAGLRPPRIRLYVDLPLAAGMVLEPDPAPCHYLLNVLRQRQGDRLALFNGRDGEWGAVLTAVERRRARLRVEEQLRVQQPEPGPSLLFAPLKRTRLEFLIEKATELGVARLEPVLTRHTVVDRVNLGRLSSIAIEAAEQCGRLTVPELAPLAPLLERVAVQPAARPLYLADETGAGAPLLQALARGPGDLLVGPEGGFAADELALLRQSPAVVPVSLGPRILRAETAALAALACWQAALGPATPTPDAP